MAKSKFPRGEERWETEHEIESPFESGERMFVDVFVDWLAHPIEFMSESQLWWIITIEELGESGQFTWSEETFGQTALLIADGWQWADKPFRRPVPYWRTL